MNSILIMELTWICGKFFRSYFNFRRSIMTWNFFCRLLCRVLWVNRVHASRVCISSLHSEESDKTTNGNQLSTTGDRIDASGAVCVPDLDQFCSWAAWPRSSSSWNSVSWNSWHGSSATTTRPSTFLVSWMLDVGLSTLRVVEYSFASTLHRLWMSVPTRGHTRWTTCTNMSTQHSMI
jgi:hypothetical protein